MQSITGTRAQNYYYYMDAAAEENGILVSNTHTHQNFTTVHLDAITVFWENLIPNNTQLTILNQYAFSTYFSTVQFCQRLYKGPYGHS